jgi:hypothetical protein
MNVYELTGEKRFLEPIPSALKYLQRSQLKDGRLSRFYELKTNRPLYMNTKYELTYEADDLPKHYGFIVGSRLDSLKSRFEKLSSQQTANSAEFSKPKQKSEVSSRPSESQVRAVIGSLDSRGAWVDNDQLRYHKRPDIKQVIKSETFIRNLNILSSYLAK